MIQIRKTTENDLPKIAKIAYKNWMNVYVEFLPKEFLDKQVEKDRVEKYRLYLNDYEKQLFSAQKESGEIIGFAACAPDKSIKNCLYLESLHVDESSRGMGVGSRLIKTVAEYALENNITQMSLCVIDGNENAQNLYRKLGAKHLKYFIEKSTFEGVEVKSEKLFWKNVDIILNL